MTLVRFKYGKFDFYMKYLVFGGCSAGRLKTLILRRVYVESTRACLFEYNEQIGQDLEEFDAQDIV